MPLFRASDRGIELLDPGLCECIGNEPEALCTPCFNDACSEQAIH